MEDPGKLFEKTRKRFSSEFVVDILMDASGSQRDRQGQVALPGIYYQRSLKLQSGAASDHELLQLLGLYSAAAIPGI